MVSDKCSMLSWAAEGNRIVNLVSFLIIRPVLE